MRKLSPNPSSSQPAFVACLNPAPLFPSRPLPPSLRYSDKKHQSSHQNLLGPATNPLPNAAKKFRSARVAALSYPSPRTSLPKKSPRLSASFTLCPVSRHEPPEPGLYLLDPLLRFLHPSTEMYHLTRLVEFEASHRYWNPEFSLEENHRTFGKCVSPYGHGHNYVLRVTLAGHSDPRTGMVLNVKELDRILKDVSGEFDHKFINADHSAFHDRIPTTENLASYMRDRIEEKLQAGRGHYRLAQVRLYEEPTLWSDVFAGEGRTMAYLTKTFGF